MGRMFFATGSALSPSKHILDIAFVRIPQPPHHKWVSYENSLPKEDEHAFHDLPKDYDIANATLTGPPQISEVGLLVKSERYFKIGRT